MASGFKNSIENMYKRMIIYSLLTALLTIIMGIVLLLLPNATNKVVGIIVGIIFLIEGINSVYKYFHREGAKLYNLNLIFGVLYALLGVVIILYPFTVVEFVTVCLGIYMIINGASKVNYALWLKRGNEESWLITLATGILIAIVGILVIFNPFASLTLTKLAGAFLIITGILDFMDTILFRNRSKEIMEIFW
ncbi:putative uncharacterized protein [Clostridium sp. CAG:609]|jgi:uncharacterized membrane protein HdeD (DUF308 family)|nr:putative uncharacterized protein [Clostridium sp. CAG:609]